MEIVRRRKICRDMMRLKRKKQKSKADQINVNKKEENQVNCSNDSRKNHPYEGNINYIHVMVDVLYDIHLFASILSTELDNFSSLAELTPRVEHLQQRCDRANCIMMILLREVWYAENNDILAKLSYSVEPHLISMMNKNQKSVPCRSYKWNLNSLTDKATKCLQLSKSKSERRIHRNKLVVFNALKRTTQCSPYTPYWMFEKII